LSRLKRRLEEKGGDFSREKREKLEEEFRKRG
jgi:hypothetical protein